MEVDFALLADAAEAINGKLYLVGGAFDTIWSSTAPVIYPRISFALKLLFTTAEIGRKHKLEIQIMHEDGKRIGSIGGEIEIGKNPNSPQGWKQQFLAVMNFQNLKFDQFGDYSFEVMINNSSVKSIPLRVAQRVQIQT